MPDDGSADADGGAPAARFWGAADVQATRESSTKEERFAGGDVRIHRHPWSAVRVFRTGGDGHSITTYLWMDVQTPTWRGKRSILVHFSESENLVRTLKQRLERWQREHAVES
ncbi:MAG TPA: hypothetical protein DFR83_24040 [Deltaproteobacteria bacterium]|nr:hypothetical protein [Deltaproteobacteria bacterium]